MRELDKNCVYDLSDLTGQERNELDNYVFNLQPELKQIGVSEFEVLSYDTEFVYWAKKSKTPTTNAKELFYTLENIQVDCCNETEERIEEMASFFEKSGYKYFNANKNRALQKDSNYVFLMLEEDKEIVVDIIDKDKTTITYEKFMELFGSEEKSKEFNNLVEVLNEELTEEAYKETEYEVKYISEKPKQYQIGIDTFQRCEANMTKEEILACVKFGIDKYTWRNKGQDLEDLEKIIDYANWGIKQLK